jgi:hypothetical protein
MVAEKSSGGKCGFTAEFVAQIRCRNSLMTTAQRREKEREKRERERERKRESRDWRGVEESKTIGGIGEQSFDRQAGPEPSRTYKSCQTTTVPTVKSGGTELLLRALAATLPQKGLPLRKCDLLLQVCDAAVTRCLA